MSESEEKQVLQQIERKIKYEKLKSLVFFILLCYACSLLILGLFFSYILLFFGIIHIIPVYIIYQLTEKWSTGDLSTTIILFSAGIILLICFTIQGIIWKLLGVLGVMLILMGISELYLFLKKGRKSKK
jgi:hypothetical protein